MFRNLLLTLSLLIAIPSFALAQNLDGAQYKPGVDANIDLYFCDWHDSMPFNTHGSLIERSILTKGDPLNPPTKGAALKYFNRFTHATLANGSSTIPTTLKGEQEFIYILSGKGTIQAKGGKSSDIYPGIAVLIPAELETTIKASPEEPLTMYLLSEPTPPGFRPNKELTVRNENTQPASIVAHWAHIWKGLIFTNDGLSEIESTGTCSFDPMTIGRPHSHEAGVEEIWAAVSGTSVAFIGKQIRMQEPGMAYLIPPDGKTPHSNINVNKDTQVKMLYIARYKDHEVRK
jgi:mannose-6-phosphate isomerase-like protein (cupin superfamily)